MSAKVGQRFRPFLRMKFALTKQDRVFFDEIEYETGGVGRNMKHGEDGLLPDPVFP